MANDNRTYHLRGIATTGVTLVDETLKDNTYAFSDYPRLDGASATTAEFKVGSTVVATLGSEGIALAAGLADTSHRTTASFMEDFHFLPSTEAEGPVILNSGSDAQALDPALDTAQAQGVIQCVTGDADGTTAADGSQLVLNTPIQLDSAGGTTVVEARLRIKSAVTTVSCFFGLTDSTSLEEPFTNSADTITSNATDAGGFLFDTDATTDQWWGVAVDSDTDDTGNATLGVAPTADTWQILRMEISNDGATVAFYIDGTLALTLSGAAGIGPDVPLYPTVIACSTTTTSRTVDVDYVKWWLVR